MTLGRSWLLVLACLVAAGAALAWADAALLHPFLPQPPPGHIEGFRARTAAPPAGFDLGGFGFGLFARGRDAFGYGWIVSTAAVLALTGLVAAALVPSRVRVAVDRIEAPGGPVVVLVAGAVATLLLVAISLLLRYTFVLVGLAPLVWLAGIAALAFGLAALGVFAGRRLQSALGAAPPLLVGVVGVVLVVDLALIPLAGWVFAGVATVAALGLAVVTRFGSADGWSLDALTWDSPTTHP